jgi:hypothetical protein
VLGPEGRGEGACPDCRLGFNSSAVFSRPAEGRLSGWWARRRSRRHLRKHELERARILRDPPLPLYGLDASWTGLRWVAGWGGSADRIVHIGLGFGDPFDEAAPLVRIFTWPLSPTTDRQTVVNAALGLAGYLWHDGGAEHHLVRPAFTSDDPTGTWPELTLPVDGQGTAFRSLAHGPFWVALGRTGQCLVTVEARAVRRDAIGLVVVDDVDPYLTPGPSPNRP